MPSDHTDVDPRQLAALLLYGGVETRRSLSQTILDEADPTLPSLLIATTRSDEPWLLRARCLEVLGAAAGQAPRHIAERILSQLFSPATGRD